MTKEQQNMKKAKKMQKATKMAKAMVPKKAATSAKTQPKKSPTKPTFHKMTIVCDKHKKCLAFAKDMVNEAKKIPGKAGHRVRDLAEGFVPG